MQQSSYQEEQAFITLQQDEERGLDYYFERYYSALCMYAASYSIPLHLAREIASEAFVRLWQNRLQIREWQKVKFLLYRIVHNAAIDHLRMQRTRLAKNIDLQRFQETEEASALEKMIEAETYYHINLLLSQLPLRCRQVFQMFYIQDKQVKEIARELGISVNTVKSQKQRALELLRQKGDQF